VGHCEPDRLQAYFKRGVWLRSRRSLPANKEDIFVPDSYFPSLMTGKAIEFIEENNRHTFFLNVAFNLPTTLNNPILNS